ncbi:MAG: GNAT family N-acetyltransferase [Spirochaetales bacterium]|nr:GNAT family N-acetyltransferase [Spirochaetales bacterium]
MSGIMLLAREKTNLLKAEQVLTEAFGKDPFYDYIFGEEVSSRNKVNLFHRFCLNYGFNYGKVYAVSPNIEGVAIWLPQNQSKISTGKAIKSGVLSLKGLLPEKPGKRWKFFKRLIAYSAYSTQLHAKYAPFPHWYLLTIGITSEYREKGYGSKLIRPILQSLDQQKMPCYLETHNPANLKLYEHYGFSIVEERKLPGSDQPHWAMLRDPKHSTE